MGTARKKETSILSATILLVLASVAPDLAIASVRLNAVLAQSIPAVSFPSPIAVPRDTSVRIDGTSSMEKINQALKGHFEEKFPGTNVEVSARGSEAALKAVLDGEIDLAAIGRPLSEQEKALGLVQVPLTRQKIAIIVGPENPFQGDVTFDNFARIFRGEIRNWSRLGGANRPIQPIDRPAESDTRRAFQTYQVFQNPPFKPGANVKEVETDSTQAVIQQLGKNGIGYAIADQVLDRQDVRIISMHGVYPDNPKYPFSQTLSYVYKGPEPNPAVASFLGYATAESSKAIVEEARAETQGAPEAIAPAAVPEPAPNRAEIGDRGNDPKFPWWLLWLLGIPLLGALLWWLLKDRNRRREPLAGVVPAAAPTAVAPTAVAATPAAAAAPEPAPITYLFLVPYNGRNAYACWQLAPAQIEAFQRQGVQQLVLRLYDVTGIPPAERHTVPILQQFGCDWKQQYLLLTLPAENRDYLVELGYLHHSGNWLPLLGSGTVRVAPSVQIVAANSAIASGTTGLVQTSPTVVQAAAASSSSCLFLVPYEGRNAYVHWRLTLNQLETLQRQGVQKPIVRLYDVTGISDARSQQRYSMQQFGCDLQQQYLLLTLPAENRDYMVELGYFHQSGNWLALLASGTVRVAASVSAPLTVAAPSANGSVTTYLQETPATVVQAAAAPSKSYLFLVPYEGKNACIYWQFSPADIESLQRQKIEKLILRLYDATGIPDSEVYRIGSLQQFTCEIEQPYLLVSLPAENRDYMVELGYLNHSGDWQPLIYSERVQYRLSQG